MDDYRFTSLEEPTEEQLGQLMHEVAIEAKENYAVALQSMFDRIRQSVRQ